MNKIKKVIFVIFFSISSLSCAINQGPDSTKKIILIGLDGADWKIIKRLINEKRLPVIEKLLKKGAGGILESIPPLISPAIWTTISTGRLRAAHEITNFQIKIKGSYEKKHNSSDLRQKKALWNILSDKGISSGVIRWFLTFPAEKINGFMVSFRYKEHIANNDNNAFYPASLKNKFGELDKLFLFPNHEFVKKVMSLKLSNQETGNNFQKTVGEKRINFLKEVLTRDTKEVFLSTKLFAKNQPNLGMVFLNGIDRISHKFWKFQGKLKEDDYFDTTIEQEKLFSNIVDDYYNYIDFLIGEIAKIAHPETDIVIISDHGFKESRFPDNTSFEPNSLLADLGILKYKEKDVIDYEKTFAFNFPDAYLEERGIYLNLSRRDPLGLIKISEKNNESKIIIKKLNKITTTSGKQLFQYVKVNSDLKEKVIQQPDILFKLNRKIKYEDKIMINKQEVPYSKYVWINKFNSGKHRKEGMIILSGKSFRTGTIDKASILDITPTILSIFNIPKAKDMPGKVLSKHLKHICKLLMPDTYENLGKKKYVGTTDSFSKKDEEKLRSLGYIK